MTLKYRIAGLSDAATLARMNQQLIQDEGHRNAMTSAQLELRMRGWLQSEYTAAIFEDENAPVAYALFRDDGDSIYIRQFFVDRSLRRKRIGSAAMKMMLTEIFPQHKRIVLEALVHNEAGRKFYASNGFREYAVTYELIPDGN